MVYRFVIQSEESVSVVRYCCCCLSKFWINKRTYASHIHLQWHIARKSNVCASSWFGWIRLDRFVFCVWIKSLVHAFILGRVFVCLCVHVMEWNGVWELHEHLFVCGCVRRCANRETWIAWNQIEYAPHCLCVFVFECSGRKYNNALLNKNKFNEDIYFICSLFLHSFFFFLSFSLSFARANFFCLEWMIKTKIVAAKMDKSSSHTHTLTHQKEVLFALSCITFIY